MKIHKYLTLCMIILQVISCSSSSNLQLSPNVQKDISFQEFILGRWIGEFPEDRGGQVDMVQYQLEFVEPNLLYFRRVSPHPSEGDNMNFEYHFIDENRIELKGRLLDEWQLSRDDYGYLTIHSLNSILPDGQYRRMVATNKTPTAIYLTLLVLILVILFLTYRRRLRKTI